MLVWIAAGGSYNDGGNAAMNEKLMYLRFRLADRFEHWVAVTSFTILAITGLIQKFALVKLSQSIISLLGGIEVVRIIHRAAAVILMIEVVYHLGRAAYKVFVQRKQMSMLPTFEDIRNALYVIQHNLSRRDSKPQQGRYTFDEKFEYWAFIWGTVIMAITGFILWNPIATAKILPGEFIPAAKAAHGGEALLAVLAIIVWHLYHVHLKRFNKSMFTGYLSEEEMLEDHALELATIKLDRKVDQMGLQKRRRSFYIVYPIVAVLLLVGIFFFVTFEETAIKTIPPIEDVVIFAPLTPPTAQPTATTSQDLPNSWNAGLGNLLADKCAGCHSAASAAGALDLTSYQGALAGGRTGAGIVPGDPDGSVIVQRQAEGNHPGQLSGYELAFIRNWIAADAPEE